MTRGACGRNVSTMAPNETIRVWVTSVDYHGGPVAVGRGETDDAGSVEFIAEPRALWAISEALDAGDGPVLAAIPTWWRMIRSGSRLSALAG